MLSESGWFQALSLRERMAAMESAGWPEADGESKLARSRLARWCSEPAFRESECLFQERLALDGATEETLTRLLVLTPAQATGRTAATPDWWRELSEALAEYKPACPSAITKTFPDRPDADFLNLVGPLAERACDRVREGLRQQERMGHERLFEDGVVEESLLGTLWRQLLAMVSRTLVLELNVARLQGQLAGESAEERFGSFVERLGKPEIAAALFDEYPVLARQVMIRLHQWEARTLEFFAHVREDRSVIEETFFEGRNPGRLAAIEGEAGDRHREGRSVVVARFASGNRVVYKPRGLAVDTRYQELLLWLNARGQQPAFRVLKILDRGDHGWCEFVEAHECHSREEVQRFYRRQGANLALLYLLHAVDFHHENVIASGEHPVLVDLESLLHPVLADAGAGKPEPVAAEALLDSVVRTGLLPFRFGVPEGESEGVDVSGLGGAAGQRTARPVPVWRNAGTDVMHFSRQRVGMPARENRARIDGQETSARDFAEDLLAGFRDTYRLLVRHREELGFGGGPVERFAGTEIRCIVRSTETYGMLLAESFYPNLLRNGLDRERFLDYLWIGAERKPARRRLIASERRDLENGDIPIFMTRPESHSLWDSGGKQIEGVLAKSGLELARQRLQRLGEADLSRQTRLILASLAALDMDDGTGQRAATQRAAAEREARPDELLEEARRIGDRLESLALQGEDGEIGWIGISLLKDCYWTLTPAGLDLYSGLAGIGLFLIYLGEMTGEPRYRRCARQVVETIRRYGAELRPEDGMPIGAFGPWGGMLYLLTHAGVAWQEPKLLKEAEGFVALLASQIERDSRLDIIGGSAGCLAVLLALHRAGASASALEAACRCGSRLVIAAKPMKQGSAWQTLDESEAPLAGFSHGAAGISWALLELAAASGEEGFRTAATQGFLYERSLFSAAKDNWRDLRQFPGPAAPRRKRRWMVAWCHGACGIGLSRLLARKHLGDPEFGKEITAAVRATRREESANHSLCHGTFGNLDFLLQAAEQLGNGELRAQVYRTAAATLDEARKGGWLCGVPGATETPGLMAGLAGIGYGLLRLARPAEVPSVLALEGPRRAGTVAGS
jgi:type 2 lantibiotic biosynthesis protein LanM